MKTQNLSNERCRRLFGDEDEWADRQYEVLSLSAEKPPATTSGKGHSSAGQAHPTMPDLDFVRIHAALQAFFESESQTEYKALIGGRCISFGTKEEKFRALLAAWHDNREPGSSTVSVHDPIFLQVLGMGEPAIPLLLREIQNDAGHWFIALPYISGNDVVTPEMRGRIGAIREAWLAWGKRHGYHA